MSCLRGTPTDLYLSLCRSSSWNTDLMIIPDVTSLCEYCSQLVHSDTSRDTINGVAIVHDHRPLSHVISSVVNHLANSFSTVCHNAWSRLEMRTHLAFVIATAVSSDGASSCPRRHEQSVACLRVAGAVERANVWKSRSSATLGFPKVRTASPRNLVSRRVRRGPL